MKNQDQKEKMLMENGQFVQAKKAIENTYPDLGPWVCFRDIRWFAAIKIGQKGTDIGVRVWNESERITWELSAQSPAGKVIGCTGAIIKQAAPEPAIVGLKEWQADNHYTDNNELTSIDDIAEARTYVTEKVKVVWLRFSGGIAWKESNYLSRCRKLMTAVLGRDMSEHDSAIMISEIAEINCYSNICDAENILIYFDQQEATGISDIRVFDKNGLCLLELRGIKLVNDLDELQNAEVYLLEMIKGIICDITGMVEEEIDETLAFTQFGLDSIAISEFTEMLNQELSVMITPDVLFNNPTVEKLKAYFIKNNIPDAAQLAEIDTDNGSGQEIAIIGMSGRFPEARNVEELWNILNENKNVTKVVPPERTEWRSAYDGSNPDKEAARRLGLIPGIAEFDPLFFEIAPVEAEKIDPRQRLLMQEIWRALEDAGYHSRSLTKEKIGIFIGAEDSEYKLLGGAGTDEVTSNSNAVMASRFAYFQDLTGPNMAINTACSSGLVALHEACLSIRSNECSMAIVAAANLLVTPEGYYVMEKSGMLSPTGNCSAFDKKADGMVPAEAVAVVVLKGAELARRDGDRIYADIVGDGINYDGRTNGITAPSGSAQEQLILDIMNRFQLKAEDIGCVVAHGTGTRLGDPIEVNALNSAYKQLTGRQNYCALISVKSNLGHTMAASGLVSLIGAVLCMRKQKIPATINCDEPNEYIRWNDSPLYLNRENRDWQPENGRKVMAAVSALGVSGTNAHVVLRSVLNEQEEAAVIGRHKTAPGYLLTFSAKTHEALESKIKEFREYVTTHDISEADLAAISYTLLCLREHFAYRAAFVTDVAVDWPLLLEQKGRRGRLPKKFKPQKDIIKQIEATLHAAASDPGGEEYVRVLDKLAESYCQGYDETVAHLWEEGRKVMKPVGFYPFERGQYWLPKLSDDEQLKSQRRLKLHPMVHDNESDFTGQRYHSRFTGREFFFRDHHIKGIPVLPGVAYLEMAYTAALDAIGIRSSDDKSMISVLIREVGWFSPISLESQELSVMTELELNGHNTLSFNICTQAEEKHIHCKGYVEFGQWQPVEKRELDRLRQEALQSRDIDKLYQSYAQNGLFYGQEFSCITELYTGENLIMAKLKNGSDADNQKMIIRPGILDGAFQSTAVFELIDKQKTPLMIPFAAESIRICRPCTDVMWSVARKNTTGGNVVSYDLDLFDEKGNLCIQVRRFSSRVLASGEISGHDTFLIRPSWQEETITVENPGYAEVRRVVVLCQITKEEAGFMTPVAEAVKPEQVYSIFDEDKNYEEYARKLFQIIKKLFQQKYLGQFLLQVVYREEMTAAGLGGLIGLLKSAAGENPQMIVQLVAADDVRQVAACLAAEVGPKVATEVRYKQGKRYIRIYNRVPATDSDKEIVSCWKERGVYMITGGAGGLGLIFAAEILRQCEFCTIILTGRSPEKKITRQLKALPQTDGQTVEYIRLDLTDREETRRVIHDIRQKYHALDGVIHAAGIIRDNYLIRKTDEEFMEVLAPKVAGARNLDAALGEDPMDFMIFFSSTSGVAGNAGQSDYGAAGGFLDAFAAHRNERRRTISIDWSLWKHGGMRMGKEKEALLVKQAGIIPLETVDAIAVFYQIISDKSSQTIVFSGHPEKIMRTLFNSGRLEQGRYGKEAGVIPDLEDKVIALLKRVLSTSLKIAENRIDEDAPLEEYGVDSILTMDMTSALEEHFGILPKTLFFEYQTIKELSGYFILSHGDKLNLVLNNDAKVPAPSIKAEKKINPLEYLSRRALLSIPNHHPSGEEKDDEIAIIGIAGKYPKAEDVEAFWDNLRQGRDCIEEIPLKRWDHRRYYDPDKTKPGKTYSKWGGFIDGADEFDPLFFGISPREAVNMDPQERQFLMCVYKAIEDAGYTKENITGKERAVGVFAGAMYADYQLHAAYEQAKGNMVTVTGTVASIANRVSYFFNFNGPSITIDTMCSSSLIALHFACQSIKNKECRVAVAGGVNLTIHPNKYLVLSSGKYASSDGYCKSFGEGGDGYVPGEGVGAVILKPLREAIDDKDHIYGVVKATVINHGGKTNGYTIPNPNAQAELIKTALQGSGIDPRTINYIEAHGTGTALGDPIEITGLAKAFEAYTSDKEFCYIGSVKSNIGHCEGAAGIAGISKVLMQLKYRKIAPSLHADVLNPLIDFAATPFVVARQLIDWERPQIKEKEQGETSLRRAGISAFGAGGSNAHVIIEEYEDVTSEEITADETEDAVAFIISARSILQLEKMLKNLREYLRKEKYPDQMLPAIAYTLQTGREAMNHRLGFMAEKMEQLIDKLGKSFESLVATVGVYYGFQEDSKRYSRQMTTATIDYMEQRDFEGLIGQWTQGEYVAWDKMYDKNQKPHRLSLPTYEFEKEHYWLLVTEDREVSEPVQEQNPVPKDDRAEIQEVGAMFEEDLKEMVARVLQIPPHKIGRNIQLADFGFDSISLVDFSGEINQRFGIETTPDLIYSYPTLAKLSEYLEKKYGKPPVSQILPMDRFDAAMPETSKQAQVAEVTEKNDLPDTAIAVIGMSGRFPAAVNIDEFWEILKNNQEVISEVKRAGFGYRPGEEPVKMGILPGVDEFDPQFFNISPKDAEEMDPKQRILLEEAYKAIENAGIGNGQLKKYQVGVFVGAEDGDYNTKVNEDAAILSNHNAVLSARFAYLLNLTGPNFTINTACSSSLVALHEAVLSLKYGECDIAVVAGANIITTAERIRAMRNANMLSPSGMCRPFDKRADGMVPGEAVAVVVLKKMAMARADRNPILATIIGSGINYDGQTNGITAPSGKSQTELIQSVYKRSHVNPEDVTYIVSHGTGTKLGDPIEINALTDAFQVGTGKSAFCALTSVKANIGHTMAASGLVSFIGLVMAMQEAMIPASINCEQVNDYIHAKDSPFYINRANKDWPDVGKPRIGGVSAFGVSGTNAHVIVAGSQPAELGARLRSERPSYLLLLSARSSRALSQKAADLAQMLEHASEETDLQSISYTLFTGRLHYNYRLAIICSDMTEARELLNKAASGETASGISYGVVSRDFKEKMVYQTLVAEMIKEHDSFMTIPNRYIEVLHLFAGMYCEGYTEGFDVIWSKSDAAIVRLPNYPFLRDHYWITDSEERVGEIIYLYPRWQEKLPPAADSFPAKTGYMVILAGVDAGQIGLKDLRADEKPDKVIVLNKTSGDYCEYAEQLLNAVKELLSLREYHKIFLQVVYHDAELNGCLAGLSGFNKTIGKENPRFVVQTVRVEGQLMAGLGRLLSAERKYRHDGSICFREGRRYSEVYAEWADGTSLAPLPWREGGSYLITGGMGGLGLIFAQEILNKTTKCKLILTGRSPLEKVRERLDRLPATPSQNVEYIAVNITDKEETARLIQDITERFGTLNGVLHAAGVVADGFIIQKEGNVFRRVIEPKVRGIQNLDAAIGKMPLDFMVLFASSAGLLGNVGQSDYAAANAYMDAYAVWRNHRVRQQECYGRTLSIDWSFWREGGMTMPDEKKRLLMETTGIAPLETAAGIQAFYTAFQTSQDAVAVLCGDVNKIRDKIVKQDFPDVPPPPKQEGDEKNQTIALLKDVLAANIKLAKEHISEDTLFSEYGIDSIIALKLTDILEEKFGPLPKTLFYEYQTINDLAAYFMTDHMAGPDQTSDQKEAAASSVASAVASAVATAAASDSETVKDIAIIGMAIKCPGADNADQFWKNLCEGKDCITTIPQERFDINEYYNPDKNEKGSIYAKWGGFISGVDEFDPMFFNISPKDAAALDPQNRLFLQCAHAAVEDAGYTNNNLAGSKHDVGVFVGVLYEEYQLYAAQEQAKGNPIAVGSSAAAIANLVSYYGNFNGPSMSLDTMCSSSMTSLHLACSSLRLGECSVAIAGGVNVSIHPNKFLSLATDQFLSTNGKCTAFGQGGNGYVPSEGVGALILKPLKKAEEDGDHIYAVIKGTALNHGGKTNGFTVPNPNAQTEIIRKACRQAGVDARAISYVEAHGTGTSLGDPIEIKGLTKAFRDDTQDNQFCYIGSVKSNIGHCENAAGVVSMAKVLLQMKYGKLVPSIHTDELNPYIEFEKTPFIVSRTLQNWERPVLHSSSGAKEYPRIAAVSGFGAGGSNVHMILQEYLEDSQSILRGQRTAYIILLSARRKEQLLTYIKQVGAYLDNHDLADTDLPSIAYCLQTGREAMNYRLGFTVITMAELKEKFALLDAMSDVPGVYTGDKGENMEILSSLQKSADEAFDVWLETEQYEHLIQAWTRGVTVDWTRLYQKNDRPGKISLPTYPFAREKYWYTDIKLRKKEPLLKKAATKAVKSMENEIKQVINDILEIPYDLIDVYQNFEVLGFNSVSLVEFSVMLTEKFGVQITPDTFYNYPNVKTLADYCATEFSDIDKQNDISSNDVSSDVSSKQSDVTSKLSYTSSKEGVTSGKSATSSAAESKEEIKVAIVGISGRFPEADNPERLWDILAEGREVIKKMPAERTEWNRVYEDTISEKAAGRRLGVLSDIQMFDPAFFEISPREAVNMDPRQRLLLEEMWKALEDAGYADKTVEENMGVYVGAEDSNYHELLSDVSVTANHNAVLAARLAYFLNIRGANMTINTACSSSLAALHQAVLSIKGSESDAAIVGSVNILVRPDSYLAMEGAGMVSPDGICYAFDRRANGMVPAEAVAAVVLKRLDKAIRDGNHIYATIAGSGINYDGKTNGITAPSGIAQMNLMETVYQRFRINPEDITYIITHGTGTKLGDSIEINALHRVFKKYTDRQNYCALTSIKPNVGHALAASGLVSMIGMIMAMKHQMIPASIHAEEESDYINWKDSPLFINRQNRQWVPEAGKTLLGAVSSFGMSGTNVHVLLENFRADIREINQVPEHLLVFSAPKEESLKEILRKYCEYFAARELIGNQEMQRIAHTLSKGRSHFRYRCAIVTSDSIQAVALLKKAGNKTEDNDICYGTTVKNFEEDPEERCEITWINDRMRREELPAHEYGSLIRRLAAFYIAGYEGIGQEVNLGFVSLPTYPFLHKSYWPQAKPVSKVRLGVSTEQHDSPAETAAKTAGIEKLQSEKPQSGKSQSAKLQLRNISVELEASADDTIVSQTEAISLPNRSASDSTTDRAEIIHELVKTLADELYIEEAEIDLDNSFTEMGLDSIIGVEWVSKINKKYPVDVKSTQLYNYATAAEFLNYIIDKIVLCRPQEEIVAGMDKLMKNLAGSLAEELFIDESEIDLLQSFTEMGMDSIIGVEWIRRINKEYGLNINTTKIYQYPNIMEFASYINREYGGKPSADENKTADKTNNQDYFNQLLNQIQSGSIVN